jgi:predicted dehydrogenase
MSEPLRIGLVGAGPWARLFTGPMLADSPDAEFVGVWARRPEAAAEVATAHGDRAGMAWSAKGLTVPARPRERPIRLALSVNC